MIGICGCVHRSSLEYLLANFCKPIRLGADVQRCNERLPSL
jgi:hypothetical protein